VGPSDGTVAGPVDEPGPAAAIEAIWRLESRRALATLIRLLGDFDLAEEALHDAFRAALEQWPHEGVPANPRAWLVSTGRFKAIDGLRRRARFEPLDDHLERVESMPAPEPDDTSAIEDDQLRLVFTCCHPALAPDAQVALALREVCGLTTEAIAHAFLQPAPTIAQRIVRAKAKIRDARIPYDVPEEHELPARLDAVLRVIYLVFNEGYAASTGDAPLRADLSREAIRLARLVCELLPAAHRAEATGLLALMLLHDARRAARTTPEGDLILLDDQDRSLWDAAQIGEGLALVAQALRAKPVGRYAVQAAIAALHAEAREPAHTDWAQIVALYDVALRIEASPVLELNRAVALSMHAGPQVGLEVIDALVARGELADFHLLHAARADMLCKLARDDEARATYERAHALARLDAERRLLQRRIDALACPRRTRPDPAIG
jgi:RNA polymerase sigma-70 factor (ECF subfamily)